MYACMQEQNEHVVYHACMYATHVMYARVKHSYKRCRLALFHVLTRFSAATTQRLCSVSEL
jgi:hypothetical protein